MAKPAPILFEPVKCTFCNRQMKLALNRMPSDNYCHQCSLERRQVANKKFSFQTVRISDVIGQYLMPDALRKP